jgi:hypothetical protein
MALVRKGLVFAVLLLALSAVHAFAVTTVGYFPFNSGDVRIFHKSDGTLLYDNTFSQTSPINSWEDRVTQPGGNYVVDAYWKRDATTTRTIIGGNLHPPLATFSPNVVYPDDLEVAGTFSYSLTVESIDTTQASFTHCVQLLEDVTANGPIFGTFHYKTREWRQAGLGLVALTPDVDAAPTVIALLVYAKVGDTTFGSLPSAIGDFNADTVVDDTDTGIFFDCYLGGASAYKLVCDIYPIGAPDGVIDDNDLALFIQVWRNAHP